MRFSNHKSKYRSEGIAAFVAALALSLLMGGSAWAGEDNPNPYIKKDDSWITISGSVESVKPDSFILNYGDGEVLVEMDDGDRDADAYVLLKGDEVTVSGRIDDDFFEQTKIEAAIVYVKNIDTTFFSSSIDEESYDLFEPSVVPQLPLSRTVVRGTVSDVNGDEFLLNTGKRLLRVDVSDMDSDPLDDQGYLKIRTGDRVSVFGQIDVDLFEGRRLEADSVIKLYKRPAGS